MSLPALGMKTWKTQFENWLFVSHGTDGTLKTTTVVDCNAALTNGWYAGNPGTANAPTTSYFHFEMITMNANNARQMAYDYTTDKVWMRKLKDGSFGAWVQIWPLTASTLSGLWQPFWIWPDVSTAAVAVGQLVATRFYLPNVITDIALISTTTNTSVIYQIGIYADTPTGPGALLAQAANIPLSASGTLTTPLAFTPAGMYWLGVQNVGTTTGNIVVAKGNNPLLIGFDALPPTPGSPQNSWQISGQGTALPNPFPTAGVSHGLGSAGSVLMPSIYMKAA